MKRRFTILTAALALLAFLAIPMGMRGQAPVGTTLWGETWTGGDANETPSAYGFEGTTVYGGATLTYAQSSTNTKLYEEALAGGESPELLLSKSNQTWTISNIPTGQATGMALTFKSNKTTFDVTSTTTGITISGSQKSWTIASTSSVTTFNLTIKNTGSSNARIDDIVLSVTTAGGDTPQPTTYTVTYDANGGTGTMTDSDSPYTAGATVTVLGNEFTRTDYEFDHWNTAADDSGTSYDEDDTFTINANTTLYAQWTENTTPTPSGTTATLNIQAYATANNWENGTKYTTATVAPVTFTANGGSNTGKYYTSGQDWRFYQGESASITITVPDGYTLVSVTPTYSVSNGGVLKNGNATIISGTTVNVSGTSVTFTVGNSGSATNGQVRFTNIDVTYVSNGGTIPPSISANNVEIAYDAEEGTINYTINNEPTPAGTLTATTTAEWLTIGTVGNNVPFTCTANDATTERTATVTLTYTYERATVTKDVTVTQAAAPVVYTTIPALFEAATSTETSVLVTFNNWVVSGVSTNGKNVFVTDNEGHGFVIFSSSDMSNTYAAGNVLSGTAVTCTLKLYNGFAELLNVNATDLTITTGGTVTTADIAMAELAGVNTGALVHYENLTCSVDNNKYYLSDGTTTIQVYNSLFAFGALTDGTAYNITGVYQQFNNTKEVLPRSAADIEEVAPVLVASITVNPDEVNVDAEEHDGTLDLTYENLTITDMTDFDIQFCDANGDELSEEPDWIEVLVAEQDPEIGEGYVVSYYMVENEGPDARTAYFKVYAMDDETNLVYSNLVTISQAAPVAPVTGDKYVKVTSTADLTSGQYLIVYAEGSVAFDGSLETLDVEGNTIEVTINDSEIGIDNITIASEFTIDMTAGTIMSASGYYIGRTGDSNGMNTSATEAYTNTISIDDNGNAVVVASGGAYMRYNATSGQDRFRYFKSSSYTNQKAIQLYKKVGDEPATETYTLDITGYEAGSEGGYYLIASPVTVNPANVEGMTAGEYDLYSFDQAQDDEWRNYKQNAFNLEPGKGYLYAKQATEPDEVFHFELTGTAYNGDGKVTLQKTDGYWEGWNLVGNPWGTAATIETEDGEEVSFYVMDEDGMRFIAGDNNNVDPMQGIFVIAASNEQEVTFVPADTPAPGEGKLIVNLTASRSSVIDRAIVRFGQGTELPKFMFNPNSTKIYIPQSGEDYAVVRSAGEAEMPVNFKAAQNGTYTLSINPANVEMEYLHLVDNMTGTDIDLLETPSYTFEASTTDAANRFSLMYGIETGVNEDKAVNFAYFNGSQWVVNNSGEATLQVVDALGRVVSTKTINGNAEVSIDQTAGVYMIRLINGNNVKTQKVVVK